jgi:hypothetical protein
MQIDQHHAIAEVARIPQLPRRNLGRFGLADATNTAQPDKRSRFAFEDRSLDRRDQRLIAFVNLGDLDSVAGDRGWIRDRAILRFFFFGSRFPMPERNSPAGHCTGHCKDS